MLRLAIRDVSRKIQEEILPNAEPGSELLVTFTEVLKKIARFIPETDDGVTQTEALGARARAGLLSPLGGGPLGLPTPVPRPLGPSAGLMMRGMGPMMGPPPGPGPEYGG